MKWKLLKDHPHNESILLRDRAGQMAFAAWNPTNQAWYATVPGNVYRLPNEFEPYVWCDVLTFHEDDLNPVKSVGETDAKS